MTPQIDRPPPASEQIAEHYRAAIRDGSLSEGARLPTLAEMTDLWGVARATVQKAIGRLQVEKLVVTSPRGTFVAAREAKGASPRDRLARSSRSGSTAATGERYRVTFAQIVDAPLHVAELLGLEDTEHTGPVVRREYVIHEGDRPRALTVTWHPAHLAELVPELVSTADAIAPTMLARIEAATAPVTRGRDWMHARPADRREADALGLPTGVAILAATWCAWTETDDLVEYGETCLPARHTLSYPYRIPGDQPDPGPEHTP